MLPAMIFLATMSSAAYTYVCVPQDEWRRVLGWNGSTSDQKGACEGAGWAWAGPGGQNGLCGGCWCCRFAQPDDGCTYAGKGMSKNMDGCEGLIRRVERLGVEHPYSEVTYENVHEPFCDAFFREAMKDGPFMTRRLILENMEGILHKLCSRDGQTEQQTADCQFYVHMLDEYTSHMNHQEIAELHQMEGVKNVTQTEAYQACGRIVNKMHQRIMNGDVDGVKFVDGEDGEYFELDEVPPMTALDVHGRRLLESMSFGSALSMMLGTALINVCRSYDRVTGLLAA